MKKTISIILTLMLVMSGCFAAYCQSGTKASININVEYEKAAAVGDTFTVTVSAADNPGFCGIQFSLGYDKSVIECTQAEVGELLQGTMNAANKDGPDGAALVAATTTTVKANGTVATFKFKVLKEGDYGFTFNQMIVSDFDCRDVSVKSNVPIASGEKNTENSPSDGSNQNAGTKTGSDNAGQQTENNTSDSVKTTFNDTAGTWAESYIEEAVKKGFVQGYGEGVYAPSEQMTRAQFVTILYRAEVESLNGDSGYYTGKMPFNDTYDNQWYSRAIVWASENNIVNGVGGGNFNPGAGVTREQIATILFRLAGSKVGAETMYYNIYDETFTDSKDLSDWAKAGVYWSVYNEIWCSKANPAIGKELCPLDKADRAQIAVIMVKYDKWKGGQTQ